MKLNYIVSPGETWISWSFHDDRCLVRFNLELPSYKWRQDLTSRLNG